LGVNNSEELCKINDKMKQAKQAYKHLTGSEPKNLVVLGDETGRKFAEQFAALCNNGVSYDSGLREIEFIKVKRTAGGYFVRLVDVHRKPDGQYSGFRVDVDHVLIEELGPSLVEMNIGDSATYCIKGKNVSEIIRKRESYLHGGKQPASGKGIKRVLSREHLTESQLVRSHAFEIKGNGRDGYIADVVVMNPFGIHGQPAAMMAKTSSKYDCDVLVKKDGKEPVSAKSIFGLLNLDAPRGTNLILEAEGSDAKGYLEELVALFENKFGEG